jgi:hypothetical protein
MITWADWLIDAAFETRPRCNRRSLDSLEWRVALGRRAAT